MKHYPYPPRPSIRVSNGQERIIPLWMDKTGEVLVVDGWSVFGGNKLAKSNSLARAGSLTLIHEFSEGEEIRHAARMDNDQIVCVTKDAIYTVDEEAPAVTVRKAFDTPGSAETRIEPYFDCLQTHGSLVLAGTYGNKTDIDPPYYVYLSKDYGVTWETIWSDPWGPLDDVHVHGVALDPWRNYLWAAIGDAANADVIYSMDWGSTWTRLFDGVRFQHTVVIPTPDSILLGSDMVPDGMLRIPFETNNLFPRPDKNKMEQYNLNTFDFQTTMFGWFYRGVADFSSYPWKLLSPFVGSGDWRQFNTSWLSGDGKEWYAINHLPRSSGTAHLQVGDTRVYYWVGITPKDFKIGETGAGSIAWGRGYQWNGADWDFCLIEMNVPEWIKVQQ